MDFEYHTASPSLMAWHAEKAVQTAKNLIKKAILDTLIGIVEMHTCKN